MSAHLSFVVADAPLADFMRRLERRMELTRIGEPDRRRNLYFDAATGNRFIGLAEYEGRAYVLDHYSADMARDVDLITDLSRELQTAIVGCDVSSELGYYAFVFARGGKLLRYHDNAYSSMDAPYDVGTPLKSEELDPLEDVDGVGMRLAVREAGFEVEPIDLLEFTPYEVRRLEPSDGPHTDDYGAFLRDHRFPNRFKRPGRIRRQNGEEERAPAQSRLPRGEVGHVPVPQGRPIPPPSLAERLRRLLGGRST